MTDQTTTTSAGATAPAFDAERRATELAILDALRIVVDPEIGMNVVELALIRQVILGERESEIKMILTTPFCPYAGSMIPQVKEQAESVLQHPVQVTLLAERWDPARRRPDVVTAPSPPAGPARPSDRDDRPTARTPPSAVATGRGDDGTTALLFGGDRIPKDDPRTEAYGTLDEAVAALGLARAELDARRRLGGPARPRRPAAARPAHPARALRGRRGAGREPRRLGPPGATARPRLGRDGRRPRRRCWPTTRRGSSSPTSSSCPARRGSGGAGACPDHPPPRRAAGRHPRAGRPRPRAAPPAVPQPARRPPVGRSPARPSRRRRGPPPRHVPDGRGEPAGAAAVHGGAGRRVHRPGTSVGHAHERVSRGRPDVSRHLALPDDRSALRRESRRPPWP